MLVEVSGELSFGVTAKDLILAIIGKIGTAGGTGHVIEFGGSTIRGLSMEARMTVCNMAIEAGARAGMIAPDETTFEYLRGKPMAPKAGGFEQALQFWKTLPSDPGAFYDTRRSLTASEISPQVTWGTNPEEVVSITGNIPRPEDIKDPARRSKTERSIEYMGLTPGSPISELEIDRVFIGSCTNARIEDLREVAKIAKGKKVAESVHAMIVPGSGLVKLQAEEEGLVEIFKEAGFDWRQEPGCSMCLAMNADKLQPGERCASTSNRNFEGRQGPGSRTHLVSPAMAAAAAIRGHLVDVREF